MPAYVAFVPVAESDEGDTLYAKRELGDFGRIEKAVDAAFDNPFVEKAELVKVPNLEAFAVTRKIERIGADGEAAPKKQRRKATELPAEAPESEGSPPITEPPADNDVEPEGGTLRGLRLGGEE